MCRARGCWSPIALSLVGGATIVSSRTRPGGGPSPCPEEAVKKIVVGLGNPGSRYEKTRHNIGWLVLDRLADRIGAAGHTRARDAAATVRGRLGSEELILVKPTTYMNLSGIAVRKVLARERAPMEDLLIVVDDMDLPFGKLRLRERGSAGGHNGLRSIIGEMGTESFARLRVGIGKPRVGAVAHVLGDFEHAEQRHLEAILDAAADAVEQWAREGAHRAANRWNAWQLEVDAGEDAAGAADVPHDRPSDGRATTRGQVGSAAEKGAAPDVDGVVRTSTGWRRLLPGRGRDEGGTT
jgi:PTH1 family peptidyl-tRNA hydrolase